MLQILIQTVLFCLTLLVLMFTGFVFVSLVDFIIGIYQERTNFSYSTEEHDVIKDLVKERNKFKKNRT